MKRFVWYKTISALIILFLISTITTYSQETVSGVYSSSQRTITGVVFANGFPVENVHIQNLNLLKTTRTDEKGGYSMEAKTGDSLKFTYIGMEEVTRLVKTETNSLNIILKNKTEALEEIKVVARKKIKRTQEELFEEYNENPNLIKTSFGILNKEKSAHSLYILDEGEFNSTAPDLATAISGRIPNFGGRGMGSMNTPTPPIYEIDGVMFTVDPGILPANVKRMAYMPGLAAVTRYGNIAAGGVLIVNTKGANFSPDAKKNIEDRALVKDNIYDDSAVQILPEFLQKSPFQEELSQARTFVQAKEVYTNLKQEKSFSENSVIEAYSYFTNTWKENDYAAEIVQENWPLIEDKTPILKALAYLMDEKFDFENGKLLYERLLRLNPKHPQSYRDLANNLRNNGDFKEAAALFSRYYYLVKQGLLETGTEGIYPIIDTEFDNLIQLQGSEFLTDKTALKTSSPNTDKIAARLLFEWSIPEAAFDIQFVNPQNRYYNWEHTPEATPERLKEEKELGYASEEYLIHDALEGQWLVNLNVKDSNLNTPVYLKVTLFTDYGEPLSNKTVRVYKMGLPGIPQNLFTLQKSLY